MNIRDACVSGAGLGKLRPQGHMQLVMLLNPAHSKLEDIIVTVSNKTAEFHTFSPSFNDHFFQEQNTMAHVAMVLSNFSLLSTHFLHNL